jgi:N-acetylglucosaminyldiphosphoundecaprenol N-acetyl-beta-D-mannosaminyltransferase
MSGSLGVVLDGLAFDPISEGEVVARICQALERGAGGRIVTVNVDILRQAARDAATRADLAAADLIVADGAPLVWASRLAGTPLPQRVAGSSLIWSLSAGVAREGRSVYVLGGRPVGNDEVPPANDRIPASGAERAASMLTASCPDLRIAGHASPPYGFDADPALLADVCSDVVEAKPDVVFVGLGFPRQERLIARLHSDLPGAWFLGCGAAVNFVAGDRRRAPLWMQRGGLEWVHRLGCEPRRLAGRYLGHDAPYALRLLTTAALHRSVRPVSS